MRTRVEFLVHCTNLRLRYPYVIFEKGNDAHRARFRRFFSSSELGRRISRVARSPVIRRKGACILQKFKNIHLGKQTLSRFRIRFRPDHN